MTARYLISMTSSPLQFRLLYFQNHNIDGFQHSFIYGLDTEAGTVSASYQLP